MDYEKLIKAVNLCGSTPKVEQCKKCAYWAGGDMSKCIPRMTTDAATALATFQAENEKLQTLSKLGNMRAQDYRIMRDRAVKAENENEKLRAELDDLRAQWDMYGGDVGITAVYKELEQVKRALAMMWFSYVNSDKEMPHSYETEALDEAERILGPWAECMPKYLRRGQKED